MKQLKINIPDGYQIDTFNTETGEVAFKPTQPEITAENLFLQIFDGCTVRFDMEKYPNSIFYFDKDGNFLAEYDSQTNFFWVSYPKVWQVFEAQFSLNYDLLREVLSQQIEQHFKLTQVTAKSSLFRLYNLVEQHFKLK